MPLLRSLPIPRRWSRRQLNSPSRWWCRNLLLSTPLLPHLPQCWCRARVDHARRALAQHRQPRQRRRQPARKQWRRHRSPSLRQLPHFPRCRLQAALVHRAPVLVAPAAHSRRVLVVLAALVGLVGLAVPSRRGRVAHAHPCLLLLLQRLPRMVMGRRHQRHSWPALQGSTRVG